MKRLLTALAIILVVVIAGMTALVLLVNPNDFRGYMVKKVEDKTGYRLSVEGDLRWHVWPQLSILAGRMTLTAPGAKQAIVSAENMRLDVELWPLLSHQLSVKNVVLKGGVIRLAPETTEQNLVKAASQHYDDSDHLTSIPILGKGSHQTLDLDKIDIMDTVLIWQRSPNDIINVRDINLSASRNGDTDVDVNAKARINRDQRELVLSLDGRISFDSLAQKVSAQIKSLNYALQGTGLPTQGIQGDSQFNLDYLLANKSFQIEKLDFSLNNNRFLGMFRGELKGVPAYKLALKSDALNLADFSETQLPKGSSINEATSASTNNTLGKGIDDKSIPMNFSWLSHFDADVDISIANLTVNQVIFNGVALQANNHQGIVDLKTLRIKQENGLANLTGTLHTIKPKENIALTLDVKKLALSPVLQALNLPETITGTLDMTGKFNNDSMAVNLLPMWYGDADLQIDSARLHGLNVQQLIQQAVSRNRRDIQGSESYEKYTEVKQLQLNSSLRNGKLTISNLVGSSELLNVKGNGLLNLLNKQCDMNLNIQIVQGWKGKSEIVKILQENMIPLRIYGPWQQLHYQVNVDQLLKDQLQNKLGKAIDRWVDKHKDKEEAKEVKKLLDKLR